VENAVENHYSDVENSQRKMNDEVIKSVGPPVCHKL
jgi:hypothetical protein